MESGYPHGFDTEVFDVQALYEAEAKASDPYDREHATPYIWKRPKEYPSVIVDPRPDRRSWRLTVDTPEDYELIAAIYDTLYPDKPDFGYAELIALFEARPELLKINTSAHAPAHASAH
jgi:spore coat polysaccharide biosynthesis protein SpsF